MSTRSTTAITATTNVGKESSLLISILFNLFYFSFDYHLNHLNEGWGSRCISSPQYFFYFLLFHYLLFTIRLRYETATISHRQAIAMGPMITETATL